MKNQQPMNPHQAAVARAYAAGEFFYLADDPNWRANLQNCADGLFRFLMIELSSTEDCDDDAEALQRLRMAENEIQDAIAAIQARLAAPLAAPPLS